MFDSFCRLFIDTELDRKELFNRIFTFTGGNISGRHDIITSWCIISVTKNGYYNAEAHKNAPDDYIYWELSAEIEIVKNVSEECYIDNINKLIEFLKNICSGIVPSSDFEDKLESKNKAQ